MTPALGVVLVLLLTIATTASAWAWGSLRSERAARSAYLDALRPLVREAVRDALGDVRTDNTAELEAVLHKWLGYGAQQPVEGEVEQPLVPVEERAAAELTDASLESIREGFMREYGLSGRRLDEVMAQVRAQLTPVGFD